MKKNSFAKYVILLALGIVLAAVGFLITGDGTKAVSGVCMGVGAGLVGMSIAKLVMYCFYRSRPDLEKQSEIESNDERSIAITNRAKAKAFDITVRVMLVIPFLLILTYSPLWLTLIAVAIFIFGFCVQFYYIAQYSKEM